MVEKPPELSTEKTLSLVQAGTDPGQKGTKHQGTAYRDCNVQAVQRLVHTVIESAPDTR